MAVHEWRVLAHLRTTFEVDKGRNAPLRSLQIHARIYGPTQSRRLIHETESESEVETVCVYTVYEAAHGRAQETVPAREAQRDYEDVIAAVQSAKGARAK